MLEIKEKSEAKHILHAIRSCISIKQFLKGEVNNKKIINTMNSNVGEKTINDLIKNNANKTQKKIALEYLKYLYKNLLKELK